MVALFNVKVPPCRVDQVNVQKSTIPGCLQTFTCHPAVWNGERLRSRPSGGVVQRDIEKSKGHETNKQNKTTSKEPIKALREERGGHRARLQSRGVPGCRGVPPWGSATGGRLRWQALARMRDGPVEGLLL